MSEFKNQDTEVKADIGKIVAKLLENSKLRITLAKWNEAHNESYFIKAKLIGQENTEIGYQQLNDKKLTLEEAQNEYERITDKVKKGEYTIEILEHRAMNLKLI